MLKILGQDFSMAINLKNSLNAQIKNIAKSTPLKSYMWFMKLPAIGDMSEDFVIDISTRITNMSVPYLQYETEKESIGNSFRYFAKSVDIGNITFEIIEMNDGKTRQYLNAWQSAMTGAKILGDSSIAVNAFNPPTMYKNKVIVFRLDDLKSTVYHDIYSGYFISGLEDMTSDYESSELMKYSVTLTGDEITNIDPKGREDSLIDNSTTIAARVEELADKVGNVAEFVENVSNARKSGIRGVVDILG